MATSVASLEDQVGVALESMTQIGGAFFPNNMSRVVDCLFLQTEYPRTLHSYVDSAGGTAVAVGRSWSTKKGWVVLSPPPILELERSKAEDSLFDNAQPLRWKLNGCVLPVWGKEGLVMFFFRPISFLGKVGEVEYLRRRVKEWQRVFSQVLDLPLPPSSLY